MRSSTCVMPQLPGKDVAEIDLPSVEADPAAARHGDRVVVKRVRQLLEPALHARRAARTRPPAPSYPRPGAAGPGCSALRRYRKGACCCSGGLGGFLLERQMHALFRRFAAAFQAACPNRPSAPMAIWPASRRVHGLRRCRHVLQSARRSWSSLGHRSGHRHGDRHRVQRLSFVGLAGDRPCRRADRAPGSPVRIVP